MEYYFTWNDFQECVHLVWHTVKFRHSIFLVYLSCLKRVVFTQLSMHVERQHISYIVLSNFVLWIFRFVEIIEIKRGNDKYNMYGDFTCNFQVLRQLKSYKWKLEPPYHSTFTHISIYSLKFFTDISWCELENVFTFHPFNCRVTICNHSFFRHSILGSST